MAPAADESGRAAIFHADAYEPNNSLDNANIVTNLREAANVSVAVEINGSVQSVGDSADCFIFTPNHSSSYDVYLCAHTCADILQDDAVYIMLCDQHQRHPSKLRIEGCR